MLSAFVTQTDANNSKERAEYSDIKASYSALLLLTFGDYGLLAFALEALSSFPCINSLASNRNEFKLAKDETVHQTEIAELYQSLEALAAMEAAIGSSSVSIKNVNPFLHAFDTDMANHSVVEKPTGNTDICTGQDLHLLEIEDESKVTPTTNVAEALQLPAPTITQAKS
jgi:hypothetical protein